MKAIITKMAVSMKIAVMPPGSTGIDIGREPKRKTIMPITTTVI
jgi:hypothetical protein